VRKSGLKPVDFWRTGWFSLLNAIVCRQNLYLRSLVSMCDFSLLHDFG